MDAKRFKEAYEKLQSLDDRLTYKVRPRSSSLSHATIEQLEERNRDLADYTIELKEVLEELFLAIGSKSDSSP